MKVIKKLIIVMLTLLLLTFCFQRTVEAKADDEEAEETQKITYESGKWYKLLDTDLEWCFDTETKTLTIKGNGEIPGNQGCDDYTKLPWWDFDDIQHIILGEGITVIGPQAFYFKGCHIISIDLPESLKEIGDYAFQGAYQLEKVKFPKDLEIIGCYAFESCKLSKIELPQHLKVINNGAFVGCNLKKVVIPNTVEFLGSGAFALCKCMTDIVLPEHIEVINDQLFSNCINLKRITIPDSVTKIDYRAFSDCNSLEEIILPQSVVYLGEKAFSNCNSLTHIELPMKLKTIHEKCFLGCTNLKSIVLPKNLTAIGLEAFSRCTSLTNIELPMKLKTIREKCFLGCTNLKSIVLPKNLTAIGLEAFRESGLTSIVIPTNVTLLRCDIFRGCNKLKTIQVESKKLKKVNKYAFRGIPENATVIFPKSKKEVYYSMFKEFPMHGSYLGTKWWIDSNKKILYFEADGDMSEDSDVSPWTIWNSYVEKVVFGKDITYIAPLTLLDLVGVIEVVLPNKLKRIDEYTFYKTAIKELIIPENVTTIDENAFNECSDLKQIILKTEKLNNVSEGAWRGLGKGVQIIAPLSKKAEYETMFEQTKLDPEIDVIYK